MRRTERLSVIVSTREKEMAREIAERHGVSIATAIRMLLRTAARQQTPQGAQNAGAN